MRADYEVLGVIGKGQTVARCDNVYFGNSAEELHLFLFTQSLYSLLVDLLVFVSLAHTIQTYLSKYIHLICIVHVESLQTERVVCGGADFNSPHAIQHFVCELAFPKRTWKSAFWGRAHGFVF